jgi:hypothetical protein
MGRLVAKSLVTFMMKGIIIAVAAALLWFAVWACWKLKPLMPRGQTICLGTWTIGDFDIQIWQRKKAIIDEPFSTSLYIRRGASEWRQYYLSHEDTYAPRYGLSGTNEVSRVVCGAEVVGEIRLSSGEYVRTGGGVSLEAVFTHNPP